MMGIRIGRLGAVAAALAMGLAATGAQAQTEEGVFMKDLLGSIGIIEKEKDPIQYRERAPLVIPPKLELPTPGAGAQARNGQWPNDPDVAAARRREADARTPTTEREGYRTRSQSDTRLSPEEMRAGRVAGAGLSNKPAPVRSDADFGDRYNPFLFNPVQSRINPENEEGATPSRRRLTQPPTEYRVPVEGVRATREAPTTRVMDEDVKGFARQQRP